MDTRELDRIDAELARIGEEGTAADYVEAMLRHPTHGRLMRAFALEEDAPEYEETMRRIHAKFGLEREQSIAVAAGTT